MVYLIVSDIHGSTRGLEYLKSAIYLHKPDVIILLGDNLYGAIDGSASAVASYFRFSEIPVLGVMGNCDFPQDAEAMGLDLPYERSFRFHDHRVIMQHHAFTRDLGPGDIGLFGHTHIKLLHENDGVILCNPGSLGKPRDGSPGYAVLEDGGIYLYDANKFQIIESVKFKH